MGTYKPRQFGFMTGLNTTRLEDAPEFPSYAEFANARTNKGSLVRRAGMVRLARFTDPTSILSLDGSDDKCVPASDTRINQLGTQWTLDVLFKTTDLSADRVIIGGAGASDPWIILTHKTTGTVQAVVTDSSAAATTLTVASITANTVAALRLTRDGATLTLDVNGTTDTDTMSATNLTASNALAFAADNSSGYFKGAIDRITLYRTVKTDESDRFCRILNPRAPSVIADWVFISDGNSKILDRGPLGLHAIITGGASNSAASLCVNHAPILGMGANRNNSTDRILYVNAAGRFYPVTY